MADMVAAHTAAMEESLIYAAASVVYGIGEGLGRWWLDQPKLEVDQVLTLYIASVTGALDRFLNQAADLAPISR